MFEKADKEIGNFVGKYFTCIVLFVLIAGFIIATLVVCGLISFSAIFSLLFKY